MRGEKGLTDTPISREEVGVHEVMLPSVRGPETGSEAIEASASVAHTSSPVPSELAHLVEEYLADSLAKGRTRGTVAYRRVYLGQLLTWLEQRGVTRARLVTPRLLGEYLVHLKARVTDYNRAQPSPLSVKTLAAEVSVLRSFFRHLAVRRVLLFDPAEGLRLGDPAQPLPKEILTEADVCVLLAAPGTDTLGLRDRAILETLYSSGLRRAELCGLDLYDLDVASGLVRVRGGKGGRDRIVPIGREALAAIRRYLAEARLALVRRPKEPALFLAAVTHQRLGLKTMNLIVRSRAEAAGIGRRVTPHVLRHTCATHLLRGGADIRHVQAILGHASVATTQIYTRVAVEDLVAVHARHHPRAKLKVPLGPHSPAGVSSLLTAGVGRPEAKEVTPKNRV
ncbi:MAG: tyrosine-type recombinase/integrase [Thermoanaerobaculia bacterium]